MEKPLNVKLPEDIIRKLKIHCAERNLTIQVVVDCAITTYLERYNNLRDYGTASSFCRTSGGKTPAG